MIHETKKVWVEFCFTGKIEVPTNWDGDQVEFYFNDSSSCADNILDQLQRWREESGCLCHHQECKYLKDVE